MYIVIALIYLIVELPNGFNCLICIIIVAFLENATIGYSLESLCVCVCVCVCLCVCVFFCTITQKEIDLGTRNWNTS